MATTALTVDEFLSIREKIATELGKNSQTHKNTRISQAEHLMQKGFIDTAAVLKTLEPQSGLAEVAVDDDGDVP